MAKGEDTRATILGSALALASEVGLEGLSIGSLASHVKMSKSGLFAHFQSKENLQVAVLDEAARLFLARVVSPALQVRRGEPRVRALMDHWLRWADDDAMPGGCLYIAAISELDDRPGPAHDRLCELQREWLATISGTAKRAISEGHFRPDLDCEQFAFEMFAFAQGYHMRYRLLREERAERLVRFAFERLILDARARRVTPKPRRPSAAPGRRGAPRAQRERASRARRRADNV